jgi:hypothetical protein
MLAAMTGVSSAEETLRGFWGSHAACDQWRADEPDSPELGPYEISAQWIRRWQFYCLILQEEASTLEGSTWQMQLACGEGVATRPYRLELAIDARDRLTMRWQMMGEPDAHMVGPLLRCEADTP